MGRTIRRASGAGNSRRRHVPPRRCDDGCRWTATRSGMRPAVSRRRSAPLRWLAASAGGVAVLAGALWTAPRWLVPRLAARSPRCLHAVRTRERVVALTLDDGPDAAHTPAILRLLHA